MGVQLKQLPDASLGFEGADAGNGELFYHVGYQAALGLIYSGPILPRAVKLKTINFTPDVAASNAVTITCYKAPSATALASGTALHSGTLNCQGTAGTTLPATLLTTAGVTDIAAGNRMGFVISGATGAAGSGFVTFGYTLA